MKKKWRRGRRKEGSLERNGRALISNGFGNRSDDAKENDDDDDDGCGGGGDGDHDGAELFREILSYSSRGTFLSAISPKASSIARLFTCTCST
ncbi:hypothetical protein RUM43_007658 [Polyplax serrata]|uniref:Uncharacterized protein n=1 Tax=Polyplax serrata TaxID=468196 RepID=A0AAN8P613_POLSC